jgi:hypothetical protein
MTLVLLDLAHALGLWTRNLPWSATFLYEVKPRHSKVWLRPVDLNRRSPLESSWQERRPCSTAN